MKCPKCQYITFDSSERCRNCGFEFALAAPEADLPLRGEAPAEGPPRDFAFRPGPTPQDPARGAARGARAAFDLPLFTEPVAGVDDTPLIKVPATPRAPLAVRRPASDTPRRVPTVPAPAEPTHRQPVPAEPAQELDFGADVVPRPAARETRAQVSRGQRDAAGVRAGRPSADAGLQPAPAASRLAAGLIDLVILAAVDAVVVYFTLRLTGLGTADLRRLPLLPLGGFFALLNCGYLAGFTAASGQTIGKMLTGLRVVSGSGDRVPLGHAIVRAPLWALSVLPLGLGCLPALSGDGRALHDRLANTRVVRA